MTEQQPIADRLVRMPGVMAATGLQRSTIYKLIQQRRFPAPVKISERAVAWRQTDISAWMANLEEAAVSGAVGGK